MEQRVEVDVFVDCRHSPGQAMAGVSSPLRWATWWALDGNDTTDSLVSLGHATMNGREVCFTERVRGVGVMAC